MVTTTHDWRGGRGGPEVAPPQEDFPAVRLRGTTHTRCCIRVCSVMVGVPHRPLLPSLPTHPTPISLGALSVLSPHCRCVCVCVWRGQQSLLLKTVPLFDYEVPRTIGGLTSPSVHPPYRGTSRIRNSAPLAPYSRTRPRALWWS